MLTDVSILVTTFWRPGYLRECLKGIRANLPECEICVTSDDDLFTNAEGEYWDNWNTLPFDSGLTAKRNAAVNLSTRKYSLLAADDFNFAPLYVREGIERMVATLDAHPEVDVVVGTYNNKKYEGYLEYVPGEYIAEHRKKSDELPIFLKPYPAWKIDIGINYFLARTDVLREVPWDENIRPIGGEHGDWFLQMKRAGKTVVFVEGCKIEALEDRPEWRHLEYLSHRRRAQYGHQIMLKKWGVKEYREGLG